MTNSPKYWNKAKNYLSKKDNTIVKFSIPITKSTTIEIVKGEDDKITSK